MPRRRYLLVALALFIAAGLFTVFIMGPAQEAVVGTGYRDAVDPSLRVQAARWRLLDWASWVLTLTTALSSRRPSPSGCRTPPRLATPSNVSLLLTSDCCLRLRRSGDTSLALEPWA